MTMHNILSARRAGIFSLGLVAALQLGYPVLSHAADLDPVAPMPANEAIWDGAYLGGHIGYASLKASNSTTTGLPQSWSQKSGGVLGGVVVGYNFDMDGFVLGLEADAGFGGIKDTENRPGIGDVKITHHGQHTFRLRGGMPVGPGLLYATGGLGLADVWARTAAGRDKEFFWGFTVGGGYEAMVSETISARVEYLYGNYGKKTFNLGATSIRSSLDTHNIRVGVNWHFGPFN